MESFNVQLPYDGCTASLFVKDEDLWKASRSCEAVRTGSDVRAGEQNRLVTAAARPRNVVANTPKELLPFVPPLPWPPFCFEAHE
jgi:hypothetical protein